MFTFNLFGDPSLTLKGAIENNPPNKPTIIGFENGEIDVEYYYTIVTTEPENDEVSYYIDWGDDITSGWTRYLLSGEEYNVSHIWDSIGDYQIRVKAKDSFGVESDWSILEVSMPKTNIIRTSLFRIIFRNFEHNNFLYKLLDFE